MKKGTLFVISAPSGAGKSTLIARIRSMFPDLLYSISCTTRPPRELEQDGVHYHFIAGRTFQGMIDRGEFLEWKEVHGNRYGTPSYPIEQALETGRSMILDIDVQGAGDVFGKLENAVGIFINVPNLDVLEQRLRLRNTDSEEAIRTRLLNAVGEIEQGKRFQRQVVNDDLEQAVEELAAVIRKCVGDE